MQPPRNVTELRSFLGLCNVYRWFVENFGRIASPLNKKLRKVEDPEFETLNEEEIASFEKLKEELASPPVLALPRNDLT